MSTRRLLLSLILFHLTSTWSAWAYADEGMWTLDNLPREQLRTRYGFEPDQAFLNRAMQGTVRLASGCSGSLVSREGLVLTNHHCVIGCVQALSTADEDFVSKGFLAKKRGAEKQCPGMEVNQLQETSDVTATINKATHGLEGEAFSEARKNVFSALQNACVEGNAERIRCDIVELYQGAIVHLYRYARYPDVRLVFSPEFASGFFGGDPDNFNFPRFNLDMGLLRVYENGRPLSNRVYFPLRESGAKEGELVITLGHPGETERLLTVSQLQLRRDHLLPFQLMLESEYRGLLNHYSQGGDEPARIARSDLTMLENGLKVMRGERQALVAAEVMQAKREEEDGLRTWAQQQSEAVAVKNPWDATQQATSALRNFYPEYLMIASGYAFRSEIMGFARRLVRAAEERARSFEERLEGYSEAELPAIKQRVIAQRPVYADYDVIRLTWSLEKLREVLGVDHPFVRTVLGKDSPGAVAKRTIEGSALADPDLRVKLWEGGQAAIEASEDPAIQLARIINGTARLLHLKHKATVDAPMKKAAKDLAALRFARFGTSVYPDATFSLRASFGTIKGWKEGDTTVSSATTFASLFDRATPYEPFQLGEAWVQASKAIEPSRRFNQVSDNDITGGNSGSPLINAKGEIVGLIFDGNIHSLGGAFFYDGSLNRAVSVHPEAMITALKTIYPAPHLLRELRH